MATTATLPSGRIRTVLREGAVSHRGTVAVHAQRRPEAGDGRIAVVAGRKVGGAVQRNRAKRRLRGALRPMTLPPGVDLVLVARAAALAAPAGVLARDVAVAMRAAAQQAAERL